MTAAYAKTVVAVGLPLFWSNWVRPGLGLSRRGRTLANVAFAAAYAHAFASPARWRSLPLAAGALAAPLPGNDFAEWVTVHIPFGTVYSEELIFRATLDPLLADTYGVRTGSLIGAAAFGLWHIHPARAAGDSVLATVAVTTAAGLVFTSLARRRGVAAAALLHCTVNVTGAFAVRERGLP